MRKSTSHYMYKQIVICSNKLRICSNKLLFVQTNWQFVQTNCNLFEQITICSNKLVICLNILSICSNKLLFVQTNRPSYLLLIIHVFLIINHLWETSLYCYNRSVLIAADVTTQLRTLRMDTWDHTDLHT